MEVFVLIHFFDDNNLTVSRGDDNARGVRLELANGTAEEVEHHKIDDRKDDDGDDERYARLERVVKSCANGSKGNRRKDKDMDTLVM